MAYPDFLIDKRVLQRNIDKGIVDATQHETRLASLPDRTDNVAPVVVEDEEDFDDEDEAEENE